MSSLLNEFAFRITGIDLEFKKQVGPITGTEFNFHTDETDQAVDVRIHNKSGVKDFNGIRLATIANGQWQWRATTDTEHADELFHEPLPYHPQMLDFAQAAVAGRPVLLAEQKTENGTQQAVVAIDFDDSAPSPQAIIAGVERFSGSIDEIAALHGFAEANDLGIEESAQGAKLSDRTEVRILDDHIVAAGTQQPEDVLADAHFFSVEQHFYNSATFPNLSATLRDTSGSATCTSGNNSFDARAQVIAVIDGNTFRWAWAVPELQQTPVAQASLRIRNYGRQHLLADLVRPQVPVTRAFHFQLQRMAMRIVNTWTLAEVDYQGKVALILLDAPQLHMPPATPTTQAATLNVAVPDGVDRQRAQKEYERLRG